MVDSPDEECDFGDDLAGDGCSDTCQREVPVCTLTYTTGQILSGEYGEVTISIAGADTGWIDYDSLDFDNGTIITPATLNTGQQVYTSTYTATGSYTAVLIVSNNLS
ncbi:MAG: hypothetical protein H6765_10250 [Candidatus Peribacteria bacterium]|nr:MAG: hypothetical protein H6765_10250 [Candidatus Peribacteria bacterium]